MKISKWKYHFRGIREQYFIKIDIKTLALFEDFYDILKSNLFELFIYVSTCLGDDVFNAKSLEKKIEVIQL